MNILLFGKNGQLGWELRRTLCTLGTVAALDAGDLDLQQVDLLRARILELRPDVVVNASAYTDVDGAQSERDKAFAINATAPRVMAEQARLVRALLIHYSTDYVFDGKKGAPYTEADEPAPLNVYGSSKLAGEDAIKAVGGGYLVLRTAWLYSTRGSNFVTKVLRWARMHQKLHIVDDQISNPTWARILAQFTAHLLGRGTAYLHERAGLYHLAGGGYASRLDWARKILEFDPRPQEQKATDVARASSSEIPTAAVRPLFSALDCTRFSEAFGLHPPPWDHELRLALADMAN